jgi:outer membrane protein OmpA-like peptidoglycan-associated protein
MKCFFVLALAFLSITNCFCQVIVIGHPQLNNENLTNVAVTIKDGDKTIQNFNTLKKPDLMLKLNFGKIYRVYFQHPQCPVMFLEVLTNNIPEDKAQIKMTYELNIPFYYKNDEDVDTTVFSKAFHKIIFDGKSKMIDDTAYNNQFLAKVIKIKKVESLMTTDPKITEPTVIFAGKICLNTSPKLTINNRAVYLVNNKNQTIKSTFTNRFGAFSFTGIRASEISKVKLDTKNLDANNSQFTLISSKNKTIATNKSVNNICEWVLSPEDVKNCIDNNYTSNIGGKLVLASDKQKKFYANKTIYLSNKRNTIIKKTTTNILGAFVFENIKPDNTYYIGVDAKEVGNGERLDFLNKDDKLAGNFDTIAGSRKSFKVNSDYNERFNDITIADDEMRMDVKAKLYGDNVNNPIGKLKILLLNDNYQVIDSTTTDDFGSFKFKYLPFLKRFFLSAENTDNILDVFNNIIVYTNDDNLVKIMTHEKGAKFNYKPIDSEINRLRDIDIDDPWLSLIEPKKNTGQTRSLTTKTIIESILFESNKTDLLPQAKEVLDKVILVLNTNKALKIELSAHTDSKGSDVDNLKLSQLRAKSATDYICASGVERERIISVGYGEGKLLNKCSNNILCSEIEHAQNRRVEFKILEE